MKLSSNTKKKTISFYSYHLNHEKYEQIENLAKQIQAYQNFISEIYYNTYFQKQKISCGKFITEMKIYRDKEFSSSFFQQICKQGRLKITNKEFDVNYKRLMYAVKLVDIKNIAERIGKKYGITISLTNPEYTSQECSCCHHISKKNRQTQELFKCENCGFELNADLNASINIKNRILSNVLRKSCHQEIKPNKFIPIGIKHEEFKQIYTQMLNDIY